MAPPPRYIITRNLISRYFKKAIPSINSIRPDDSEFRSVFLSSEMGDPRIIETYHKCISEYEQRRKEALEVLIIL